MYFNVVFRAIQDSKRFVSFSFAFYKFDDYKSTAAAANIINNYYIITIITISIYYTL